MAEVATKKSINVVSTKKSSEVCSVQSNNGLIDLDNITASNNQLITLCDNNEDLEDDLVLANNTRNELDSEDKSLQELIESELALRICSNSADDVTVSEEPEEEPSTTQPEPVKRIVLDRREDPLDVNAEFIIAETEHCALIEEPYTYQNGHVSPQAKTGGLAFDENSDPDPLTDDLKQDIREVEEIVPSLDVDTSVSIVQANVSDVDRTTPSRELDDDNRPDRQEDGVPDPNFVNEVPLLGAPVEILSHVTDELLDLSNDPLESAPLREPSLLPSPSLDKFQEEEVQILGAVPDDVDDLRVEGQLEDVQTSGCKNVDLLVTWPDQVSLSTDGQQAGQFSDNFDETLCQQNSAAGLSREPGKALENEANKTNDVFGTIPSAKNVPIEKSLPTQDISKNEDLNRDNSLSDSQCTKSICETDLAEVMRTDESKEQLCLKESERPEVQVTSSPAESETSPEAASTREFLDIERRVLSEESSAPESASLLEAPLMGPITSSTESAVESAEMSQQDTTETDESKPTEATPIDTEFSSSPDLVEPHTRTLIESTEVHVSDTSVTILSETRYADTCDSSKPGSETRENLDSWMTVEEATKPEEQSENLELEINTDGVAVSADVNELAKSKTQIVEQDESVLHGSPASRAPLATPDGEATDVTDSSDSESREETITASSTVVTSSGTKSGAKTKKKKIEGVAGNDASSPNLTPRTKKTKKSKKSELEKENISVNGNSQDPSMRTGSRQSRPEMIDFSDEDDLSNVNVKSLTQNYVSEANRAEQEKSRKERIATGVSIKQLCRSFGDISNMGEAEHAPFGKSSRAMETEEKARSMGDLRLCERGYSRFFKDGPIFTGVSVKALKSSFNKFDALSKKTVLHVRSVDAAKVQQQLNAVGQNGDTNPSCRSCGKVVFQMEQTKAEGLVWHKNCFRCVQCSKQLNVDNYESHESTLYCKAHFKELFQPKPVEESDQPVRPRKPEMIIRENEPKELPPDVVRASDKPDLGLEELSSLNVKSRFQVFEKAGTENTNEIERSPSQIAVKRSPSILSKLAKFQAKGMDIGVADESLNGIPYEQSSESEEEEEAEETEEVETEIVKSKRTTRERPISFSKMDDIKNRWESTSQQGRRETQREARKEEIAGIRSRLFMGKQGKMKEMYQQAVAGSERVTKINAAEEIQHTTNARSIKERFERGEPIAASDDETDSSKPKPEKADEEVIAAGISRKSRSLFLELDATAAKTGRPVTPVNPTKTPADAPRRARDAFMARQVSDDVVRSTDTAEEVHVETSDISNKFKFFETYREPEKQRKQFRITPPRDGQVKMDSPDREIYRDPEVVRAEDRVDEVVRTDTARKMLSIFRQMEEKASKEELPDGPKPLKRFTPPPEDKYARQTASDSEEEEDEEGEESEAEESVEEKDPNYVRASDKVEDEFLKQAQNAARAKTLRAKFEHWEETDGKASSHHVAEMEIAQSTGDQSSIESASSLRARFESLGSQPNETPRTPKVKVNRFVEIQTNCMDVCESCQKKVYPLEKVETNNKIFHKQCFRCLQCNCILRMDTFTLNNGKLYCIPHFKQLFITRGNYDEGFGVDPHKNKWATNNTNNPSTPPPIAVSNGDV